jgi:hypothetical protein
MTIRRRCTERNCKDGRRCLEHLRFDVIWRGKRYRMPANEFAIPRMEPGKQRAIQSMEEARDWERLFIGEIISWHASARRPPAPAKLRACGPLGSRSVDDLPSLYTRYAAPTCERRWRLSPIPRRLSSACRKAVAPSRVLASRSPRTFTPGRETSPSPSPFRPGAVASARS